MTTKPRIAIVIGSTRPGRYADKAAGWMVKQTKARDDIEAERPDLYRKNGRKSPKSGGFIQTYALWRAANLAKAASWSATALRVGSSLSSSVPGSNLV
jgi:hypothetical protein